jgi:acyl-coenzyme A thioesterase PaaI-like protein
LDGASVTTWSAGEPGRSYRAIGDTGHADNTTNGSATNGGATNGGATNGGGDPGLRARRQAIDALGAAVRRLVENAAATEMPAADLLRAADRIRATADELAGRVRRREQPPTADDLLAGIRMFNPVTGTGSGLAPPLRIDLVDGEVTGRCTLGLAFEGPPTYAHGGVSALLLDQMLGYATSATGHPGLTVDLVIRYRRPVPLQTPLRLRAWVAGIEGRIVTAQGSIVAGSEPAVVLVEATGTFQELRPDQAARLFPKPLT